MKDDARATCELCDAARLTPWHYEDELCWIADCEACDAPMVVWRRHGPAPPAADVDVMIGHLTRVANEKLGEGRFSIDLQMRQIPEHFHAHARDPSRWLRRLGAAPRPEIR